jgi:uncharacterized protein (TIGR02246 family)
VAIDEKEFRKVADELAIRDLVARYCDAVTRNDEAAWADTWAEDGRWKVGPNEASGRDKVVATWKSLMGIFNDVRQIAHQSLIRIEGDRATGRWTMSELGWPKQGDPSYVLGVYTDAYVRVEGEWKFASRRFDMLYAGAPDLSGRSFPFPSDI